MELADINSFRLIELSREGIKQSVLRTNTISPQASPKVVRLSLCGGWPIFSDQPSSRGCPTLPGGWPTFSGVLFADVISNVGWPRPFAICTLRKAGTADVQVWEDPETDTTLSRGRRG